jgi:hypothetical protein
MLDCNLPQCPVHASVTCCQGCRRARPEHSHSLHWLAVVTNSSSDEVLAAGACTACRPESPTPYSCPMGLPTEPSSFFVANRLEEYQRQSEERLARMEQARADRAASKATWQALFGGTDGGDGPGVHRREGPRCVPRAGWLAGRLSVCLSYRVLVCKDNQEAGCMRWATVMHAHQALLGTTTQ